MPRMLMLFPSRRSHPDLTQLFRNMKRNRVLCILLSLCAGSAAFGLEMPSVFSDHMVLQREAPVNLWGRGDAGAEVKAVFAGQEVSGVVGSNGEWLLQLQPMDVSSEGRVLEVSSGSTELRFEDVLVGDVWLCSGQSNMAWTLRDAADGDIEIAGGGNPAIRLFQVNRVTVQEPRFSSGDKWAVCDGGAAAAFSAIGYFFGKDLQQVLDIPIGLIDSSWGGTPIAAWVREETLLSNPHTAERVRKWNAQLENFEEAHAEWEKALKAYAEEHDILVINVDDGISKEASAFHKENFDDSGWDRVEIPNMIENHIGNIDGAIWYRLKVALPKDFKNKELSLELGPIDDLDMTFVDGQEVGSHMRSEDKPYSIPRVYPVPAKLTKDGSVVIAVRLFDEAGGGGFTGGPDAMVLVNPDGAKLPLAGEWRFQVEDERPPAVGPWNVNGPEEPEGPASPNRPGILAKSMLAPVSPYTIKGSIWYQGESDVGWDPDLYELRLGIMLKDWESRWGQQELPLGIVQLANFMKLSREPVDTGWSRVRDSQLRFSQKTPKVGLAVAIDLGELDDIHPRNKHDVGRRLARWALADIYDVLDLEGGPVVRSHTVTAEGIEIRFDNVGRGLKAFHGNPLREFTIAGEDHVFHKAEARIMGVDCVVVRSDEVPNPVAVRYAWSDNPIHANLVNDQRLPASPFRTDDWPASAPE